MVFIWRLKSVKKHRVSAKLLESVFSSIQNELVLPMCFLQPVNQTVCFGRDNLD